MAATIDRQRRVEIGRERRAQTRAKIVTAAFELFGGEDGLYVRIEDVASRAGITRATFYDHFAGMVELRAAVAYELTHDFLISVAYTVSLLDDPRERASAATRFYLRRVLADPSWGWSMINLSSSGLLFGIETYRQAQRTVQEGMDSGVLRLPCSEVGRDLILGGGLAAIATMLKEEAGAEYPEQVTEAMLLGLGVPPSDAAEISRRPLPKLLNPEVQT